VKNIKTVVRGKLLLLGDFNLGNIVWSNCSTSSGLNSLESKFLDCLRKNYLIQHVLFPTRAREVVLIEGQGND
jgi:hypothetical protein